MMNNSRDTCHPIVQKFTNFAFMQIKFYLIPGLPSQDFPESQGYGIDLYELVTAEGHFRGYSGRD